MTSKIRNILVAMVAGLLLFTGCSTPPTGGVGVRVNDQQVSSTTIDQTWALLKQYPEMQLTQFNVVTYFVQFAAVDQYAADANVTVPDQDIDQLIGTNETAAKIASDPVGRKFLTDLARMQWILSNQQGTLDISSYDITVNPRYGTFDKSTNQLLANGSLSELFVE